MGNKLPLLVNTGRGSTIQWGERYLYSSRDPLGSVKKIVERVNLESKTLYIVPSPLLCYGMEEIKKNLPPESYLLGIEKFQELMAICLPHIPQDLIEKEKCQIIRSDNQAQIGQFIEDLGWDRFKKCQLIHLTGGSRLAPDFYNNLERELNHAILTFWQSKACVMKLGSLWFSNIFKNLPYFAQAPSIDQLQIKESILLCGAGESLEHSIPFIKKHRDQLFLCAVDTAYPALLEEGITPNAVFNLDGQFYNYYDFYKHEGQELYLISDITAFPASLRLEGVKNIFFSSHFAKNNLLERLKKNNLLPFSLPPLGSVGVTALYLCQVISQSPVILTGLDFSYTPGKSHAKGTLFSDLSLLWDKRTNPGGGLLKHSYKRSSRKLKGQLTGKEIHSDVTLEGYYRDFCTLTNSFKSDIFQLPLDYPSLGIPLLTDEDEQNLFSEKKGKSELKEDSARINLDGFIKEEIGLLKGIIEKWEECEARGEEDLDSLIEAVRKCNYLTLPQKQAQRHTDLVYYMEPVKKARTYLTQLEKSMDESY